jgi:DNA transformation protein
VRDESFKKFVLDQMRGLEGVAARPMFGGHGLYYGDRFFGILFKGRLYFKTTPATRPRYLREGMTPFAPNKKQTLKNYYEVPADIIESADRLVAWADDAMPGAGIQMRVRRRHF